MIIFMILDYLLLLLSVNSLSPGGPLTRFNVYD